VLPVYLKQIYIHKMYIILSFLTFTGTQCTNNKWLHYFCIMTFLLTWVKSICKQNITREFRTLHASWFQHAKDRNVVHYIQGKPETFRYVPTLHVSTGTRKKMNNKIYHYVGTVLKSNRKNRSEIQNRYPLHTNTLPLTFLTWYRHFNKEWQG